MKKDESIKGVQMHLRAAMCCIDGVRLSDVSSLGEMGELMELREKFQPLHDKFTKFLIREDKTLDDGK